MAAFIASRIARLFAALTFALAIAACGGGHGDDPPVAAERPVTVPAGPTAAFTTAAGATAFAPIAFDATTSTSSDGNALQYAEAGWKPASSNRDRDAELQDAVTNWRNELAHVVDSIYRDAGLRSSDDAAGTRLRARARELKAVQSQLASRARYLRLQVGLAPVGSIEMARLAALLAASVDQTPEASPEVARATLDRLEAIAPREIRVARGPGHEGVLLARHDVGSFAEEAAP